MRRSSSIYDLLTWVRQRLKSPESGVDAKTMAFSRVLVCRVSDNTASCAYVCRVDDTVKVTERQVTSAKELQEWSRTFGGGRYPVVAVIPKSSYLTKQMAIPKAARDDALAVLSLEMEAMLPPEFGRARVSYSDSHEQDGQDVYEVCVAREDDLEKQVEILSGLGLNPDLLLPSAVFLRAMLCDSDCPELLIVDLGSDCGFEMASLEADGSVSIRFVDYATNDPSDCGIRIAEHMRSILANHGSRDAPVTVGTIGDGEPPNVPSGGAILRDVNGLLELNPGQRVPVRQPLVALAVRLFMRATASDQLAFQEANLLPKSVMLGNWTYKVYRRLLAGVAMVLLSLGMMTLAIEILSARHERKNNELSDRIAAIRTEGENAGRRVAQYEAVKALRASSRDFFDVIAGLYKATPEGVSYGSIELSSTGQLILRGQAKSVSIPFLLPQELESQPMFQNVVLQNVGQKTTGAGSASEFLIECNLERPK